VSVELDETMHAGDTRGAAGAPVSLASGALFASRYRVDELVGEGGMGAVYRVLDNTLGEVVALKLLTLGTQRAVERFLDEVRLARRVTHPNVARTHDVGEDGGVHFLTMEYVRGVALDEVLDARGPVAPARAAELGADIARGLSAAHRAGVVHRDLKPANVLLAEEGRAVITDFGIALATTGDDDPKTGGLVGTPAYMAPEQVRGDTVDARADLYALGLILYELTTGTLPFDGPTPIALALARLQTEPVDPRTHAELPEPLAHLILRLLARDPAGRPASAPDVRAALEGLSGPGPEAPRVTTPTVSSLYAPLAPTERTLAVLPFAFRGPPEDAYLGEGLTEELIDVLARTKGLKVLSLGATRRFGEDRDPTRVARELGAHAVVDGTVQTAGERVRLAARLIDGRDGVQRWSDRFDGRYDDVFTLQETLARRVAEELRLELGARVAEQAPPEAVERYLRARRHLRGDMMTEAELAVQLLEEALELAPDLGVAKAAHAMASIRAWWGRGGDFDGSRAERAQRSVARARAEVPELAETHLSEAMFAVQTGGYRQAAQALARALAIAPTMAEAHSYLGGLQCEALQGDEGPKRLRAALELDPTLQTCHLSLARSALLDGDLATFAHHDAALAEAFPPQHVPTLISRLRWSLYRGDATDARSHFRTLRALGTDTGDRLARLCAAAVGEGSLEDARATFDSIPAWLANPRFTALMDQLATEIFLVAGANDLARAAVERAAESILIDRAWLERCSLLDPLRGDPAFEAVRATVETRAAEIWRR